MRPSAIAVALSVCIAVSADAQNGAPALGTPDPARITGGTYAVDPHHTQVLFGFNHLGFTHNAGIFAQPTGTLVLDPKAPAKAVVEVSFPVSSIATGVPKFNEHLMSADFFDAAKFPTAAFKSTSVEVDEDEAEITGNLTIKGITKEVTLDATLVGTGANPMSKKETVGFSATATIKRSDFGLGYGVPMVGDVIELRIAAAFEK
ncbi:MAG TPA: YceI family protein [Sphingobium sp.]|nr:YceI family protein [Sphingobium sp.]